MTGGTVVVGGGVVGMTIALQLQRAGEREVVVVDPGPRRQAASWGNAGHIAVEQVEPLSSPAMIAKAVHHAVLRRDSPVTLPLSQWATWVPFAARLLLAATPGRHAAGTRSLTGLMAQALPAWQRLVAEVGAPELLRERGHLIVWDTPTTAASGTAAWRSAPSGTATFRAADAAELADLTALLGKPPAGALRCVGSGQIADPDQLADALHRRLLEGGGRLVPDRVRALVVRDRRASLVLEGGEALHPASIVVAAGVRSRPLMEALGHRVPMVAERGYHLQAAGAEWPAGLPPVVFEDRSMIVTRFAQGVRASSTTELSAVDAPPDPAHWERLRRHIRALRLPFDLPGAEWMGARPTLPDYLPAIGRSRRADNVLYAFGHQHLGLTLAPVTAELVAALIGGGAPITARLAPFDIDRFLA